MKTTKDEIGKILKKLQNRLAISGCLEKNKSGLIQISGTRITLNELNSFLRSEFETLLREEREEIIKEIDKIENRMGETSIEEWKLFKHIRNALRDNIKN